MSKHTPGPWEWDCGVVPPDGPDRYSDIYTDGGETIIATFNEFFETSPAEGRANARLIAAAPELLSVLKEFGERYMGPHWINSSDEWAQFRARYEAAITKATGEPA